MFSIIFQSKILGVILGHFFLKMLSGKPEMVFIKFFHLILWVILGQFLKSFLKSFYDKVEMVSIIFRSIQILWVIRGLFQSFFFLK